MTRRRPRSSGLPFRLALLAGLAVATATPGTAVGQSAGQSHATDHSNVPVAARQVIVAIRSYEPQRSVPQIGAGIVIGRDDRRVYIATALHVVEGADRVWVAFASAPQDSIRAESVRASDDPGDLDLAIIAVPRAASPAGLDDSFDRLGLATSLRAGAEVSPVGCPDEVCWGAPSPADRILAATRLELLFQSDFVKRGSSGGGLFDRWWELVGVVTTSDPPRARAIPIDYVVDQARVWNVPIGIHRPSIPRSGYATTLGGAVMLPTGSRFPSIRIEANHVVRRPLTLHAAFLRIAPGELTGCPPQNPGLDTLILARKPCELVVNAGVAGIGAQVAWHHLAVRPFIEAGVGRTQGRYDIGGTFLEGQDVTYVPNYRSTDEKTAFVGGGGIAIEVVLRPRTVLQAMGGYWSYGDPFPPRASVSSPSEGGVPTLPAQFVPEIPRLFFGLGIKLGL